MQKIDLDRALSIYKDRFGDAGDFTFVFVGNFTTEQLKPLVETYLGSLPSKGRKGELRASKSLPNGVQTKTVTKGREPKSLSRSRSTGKPAGRATQPTTFGRCATCYRIRLREVLREDMGGVYGVQVSGGISRRPRQEYTFSVGASAACPTTSPSSRKAVFDSIQALKEQGSGRTPC